MTDLYIKKINKKNEEQKVKQEAMFGQGIGLVLFVTGGLRYLSVGSGGKEKIAILGISLGIFLFISGLVFPYILYYPSKFINKFINKLFELIFVFLLTIIYFIFIVPVGMISKNKWAKEYGFYKWQNKNIEEIKSGFKSKDMKVESCKMARLGRMGVVFNIIGYFIQRKNFILMPILFILLFVGLLFFFVTSGVVTPMIYTLF